MVETFTGARPGAGEMTTGWGWGRGRCPRSAVFIFCFFGWFGLATGARAAPAAKPAATPASKPATEPARATPAAKPAAEPFGAAGQVVPSGVVSFSYEPPGWFSATVAPQIVFLLPYRIVVGGMVSVGYSYLGEEFHVFSFSVGPLFGYYVRISRRVGLLPTAMLGYRRFGHENGLNQLIASVSAPFLFHVAPHFFVGGGPVFGATLWPNARVDFVALSTTIGGWPK